VLSWENSVIKLAASWPASVAASISVVSVMDVATSALHSRQYFPVFPGRSKSSARWPQTQHCKLNGSSLPFGPDDIGVSPRPRRAGCDSLTMIGEGM
jgi:hypothetical protein